MQPFPPRLIEVGVAVAGTVGSLILIAPTFGRKPKPTADGWSIPVKPTCHLLYYLSLIAGMGASAFCGHHLLVFGPANCLFWFGFAFGFLLVPVVLADWPEPIILDGHGLLEAGRAASRIRWQELEQVREYRVRWDRGLVIHGADGKRLVVAAIAYDSKAVLRCLMQWRNVPYHPVQEQIGTLAPLRHH